MAPGDQAIIFDPNKELLIEAEALQSRIKAQSEQTLRLRSLADRIDRQVQQDLGTLRDLDGILGRETQLQIDDLDPVLRGQRLERVAIDLLKARKGEAAEIHYREWYELIQTGGYSVAGKQPLATFLAQLNRSNQIQRIGNRTGRYKLHVA